MIQYFENINLTKKDSLNLPESIFIRPSITLVFDNVNDKLFVTKIVSPNGETAKEAFNNAKLKINQVIQKITKPLKKNSLELNHYDKV